MRVGRSVKRPRRRRAAAHGCRRSQVSPSHRRDIDRDTHTHNRHREETQRQGREPRTGGLSKSPLASTVSICCACVRGCTACGMDERLSPSPSQPLTAGAKFVSALASLFP